MGSSVAIRATDPSLATTSTHYPSNLCIAPANEQHGIISSLSPLKIEIFDCDLICTGIFVEGAAFENVVVTLWNLENERKHVKEKIIKREELKEEANKIQQQRDQASKQKTREARARKIMQEAHKKEVRTH